MESRSWHELSIDEALSAVASSREGLSAEEAERRLAADGPNEFHADPSEPAWKLFLGQFASVLVWILIAAAGVSFFIGDVVEGVTIAIIVVLAALLGFIQEYKAEEAMKELRKLTAPRANVLRGGREVTISSLEVVRGDVVPLAAGDVVPADARLIDAWELRSDEAMLTGESLPVEKTTAPLEGASLPLGDRTNLVYAGTAVVHGRARAVVVGVANATEFGKIADLLAQQEAERTPLQRDLDRLGRVLGIGSLVLAGFVALLGIWRGFDILDMFIWGVALAVAVIPEALPAVVTISLALAVKRLVKHKALIRKLPAVETLGSTNVICSDKTGTLTTSQMTVRRLVLASGSYDVTGAGLDLTGEFRAAGAPVDPGTDGPLVDLLRGAVLCNDAEIRTSDGPVELRGDPNEGALLVAARKAGLDPESERRAHPRLEEVAFSSERKRMATLHEGPGGRVAYVKGAPEGILAACDRVRLPEGVVPLDDARRARIEEAIAAMGADALRGLAVASRELPTGLLGEAERGLVFLGCFGLMDPPRPEAKAAVETCHRAGIQTVMITGDHLVTARAVARELGILEEGGDAIAGPEFDALTDEELDRRVGSIQVYARVNPAHKLRIVESQKRLGRVVAMTGDGVNDAPALKRADIGIAMGVSGTGVSREASDMILTDDNFASIVRAVQEGRRTFDNILKYLVFLLSGNMGAIFAMVLALLWTPALPIPLVAVQILFINMIMDGLPAIALSVEPAEPGLMRRRPRDRSRPMLDLATTLGILGIGALIAAITFTVFLAYEPTVDEDHARHARAMFFATLILCRLFNALNCRSFLNSAFSAEHFGNAWLLYGIGSALALMIAVLYVPALAEVFEVSSLSSEDWMVAIGAASLTLLGVEAAKAIRRRAVGPAS